MGRIALSQGTVLLIDGVQLIFQSELPDNYLSILQMPTGVPWTISEGDSGTRFPKWDDIEEALAEGKLKIVSNKNVTPRRPSNNFELDPDDAEQVDPRAKVRLFYVAAWDKSGVGLGRKALQSLIDEVSASQMASGFNWKPSTSSLMRWIKERGELGHRQVVDMVSASGRCNKKYRFPEQVSRALQGCVIWYWSLDGRSAKDTYARLRRLLRTLNNIRRAKGAQPYRCPHQETVRRYIHAEESYETWVARFGRRAADNRWRPTGSCLQATNILQITILDHTILDNWCVLNAEYRLPMGRPYLAIIIDVFSRCILAWLITYEPPQIWTVGECIKRANRPKPWFRERFPNHPHGASIHGKMSEIVLDDAWENTGRSVKDALLDLGISTTFAPIRTPTYKAIVERFFRTLNSLVVHKLAGSVSLDLETRRLLGINPEKDAVLTVEEVELLIEEAINIYHHDIHETLNAAPALIWQKAAQSGVNILHDDALLDKTLGTIDLRTLDRRGIRFQNLWYSDSTTIARILNNNVSRSPVRGRRKKSASVPVKIKYNPCDLGQIYAFDPVDKRYYPLQAEHFQYANGLSMYQHKLVREVRKQENLAFVSEEDHLAALQSLRTRIEHCAPDLRIRARKAAMRLVKQKEEPKSIEGDYVAVTLEGREHTGQLVIPNHSMMSHRTDNGSAVASAIRSKVNRNSAHKAVKSQSKLSPKNRPLITGFEQDTDDPDGSIWLSQQDR